MKQVQTGALAFLIVGLLTGCAPLLKPHAQQFSATTSLKDNRVVVTVKNLGPANVWLDPNHCPLMFKVGTVERLPLLFTPLEGGRSAVIDTCLTSLYPPEVWKVGELRSGLLTSARLPTGTYTVTAWAEPKVAPDVAGQPGRFQTVRVQAPTTVLTVP